MQSSLFNRGKPGASGREEKLAGPWPYADRPGLGLPGGVPLGDPNVWVKAFQVKYGGEFSSFGFSPAVDREKRAENKDNEMGREPLAETAGGETGARVRPGTGEKEIKEGEEETGVKRREEPLSPPSLKENSRLLVWKEFPK